LYDDDARTCQLKKYNGRYGLDPCGQKFGKVVAILSMTMDNMLSLKVRKSLEWLID
jgi:hypothetical protein